MLSNVFDGIKVSEDSFISILYNVVHRHILKRESVEIWRSVEDGMGWLRLVGSLKLYVSFAEYRLFYRALLQKRRIILRSLLIVVTP